MKRTKQEDVTTVVSRKDTSVRIKLVLKFAVVGINQILKFERYKYSNAKKMNKIAKGQQCSLS